MHRTSAPPSRSAPAGRCMGLYGSRLAPTTAIAPRSSREKPLSADQPSRMASSALAAPALPGWYLRAPARRSGLLRSAPFASPNELFRCHWKPRAMAPRKT